MISLLSVGGVLLAVLASAGCLHGAGSRSTSSVLSFAVSTPAVTNVTVYFNETGLPAGTHWRVVLVSVGLHPIGFLAQGKTSSLKVIVYAGKYTFTVHSHGYTRKQITPSGGRLDASAPGPHSKTVTFT